MNLREALLTILSDKKHRATSLNYAINYVRVALNLQEGSDAMRVQCLYILGNLQHWTVKQNPLAKEVKNILKKEGGIR